MAVPNQHPKTSQTYPGTTSIFVANITEPSKALPERQESRPGAIQNVCCTKLSQEVKAQAGGPTEKQWSLAGHTGWTPAPARW